MSDVIARLMEANLLAVFDERDPGRRAAAIAKTYAPDVAWTDEDGVSVGHQALDTKAAALQNGALQGLHFVKSGPVRQTGDLGFLAWEVHTPDNVAVASGFDVALIADDRIAKLWTILTEPG